MSWERKKNMLCGEKSDEGGCGGEEKERKTGAKVEATCQIHRPHMKVGKHAVEEEESWILVPPFITCHFYRHWGIILFQCDHPNMDTFKIVKCCFDITTFSIGTVLPIILILCFCTRVSKNKSSPLCEAVSYPSCIVTRLCSLAPIFCECVVRASFTAVVFQYFVYGAAEWVRARPQMTALQQATMYRSYHEDQSSASPIYYYLYVSIMWEHYSRVCIFSILDFNIHFYLEA